MWMTVAVMSAVVGLGAGPGVSKTDLGRTFSTLEKAFRSADAELFASRWHPEGLETNLVGGSGLAGERALAQGARKGWFLRADLKGARSVEGIGVLVGCDVWSWKKSRVVDHVWALVVRHQGRAVVLGAGESEDEVRALARRYARGDALAPPEP